MIEELAKPLGVVLLSYRRPSAAQAFLWGLASGAGFALAENFFNTTLALDVWAMVIPLRIGATAMHCLCAALTSLGYQRFLTERRYWFLLGSYGLAVAIHSLWNATVIGIAGLSVSALDNPNMAIPTLAGVVVVILLILLLALTFGAILGLIFLTRRLRANLVIAPSTESA
jgi:RsiW-degrading membrane proteinase PrsW (M82 family)